MIVERLPSLPVYRGQVEEGLQDAESWWVCNEVIVEKQIEQMTLGGEGPIVSDWQKNAFKVSGLFNILKRISAQVKEDSSLAPYQERVSLLMGRVRTFDLTIKDLLSQIERKEPITLKSV